MLPLIWVVAGCFGSGEGPAEPVDTEALELLRREAECETAPAPIVVTPSPPVTDLASLCAAFRAQPSVALRQVGCDIMAVESEQLWAVDVAGDYIVRATLLGLGVPTSTKESARPPSDDDLRSVGMDRPSLTAWLAIAAQSGVRRIERWPAVIPDPYHGQPGLVVRSDIAFQTADGWLVCMDAPSRLLYDNVPAPPGGLVCTVDPQNTHWWTCRGR